MAYRPRVDGRRGDRRSQSSHPQLAVVAVSSSRNGGKRPAGRFSGFERSIAGIGLAIAVTGVLCYLRGMGMGDLKLLAGVGAWIGPGQLVLALVATGIAGGFLAVGYALWHRSLGRSLDSTADLIAGSQSKVFGHTQPSHWTTRLH